MISVSNVSKSLGARVLFQNVSFNLNAGERFGLVGANGSGKSTFLRILAGDEEATSGVISFAKMARLGFLRQDQSIDGDAQILNFAMRGQKEVHEAMMRKEVLLHDPKGDIDAHLLSNLEDIIAKHDGYTLESRTAEILEGLGIETSVHQNSISTLSGGFRLRVLLAQVLVSAPDILLLDEPTNHLDILSIRWLEKFLASYKGCVVVISHDRRFVENICTAILDIDYQTITLYSGDYKFFTDKKILERERLETQIGRQKKEIAHKQEFVDRFGAKASKASQAQSRLKQIEKIVVAELPESSRFEPKFQFLQKRPSGKIALKIDNVSKSFGDKKVLTGVTLNVARGDKIAVIGKNGIGKSTLLKILAGDLEATGGNFEWGFEAQVGYFAQDHDALLKKESKTVLDWLWQFCPAETMSVVRGTLGRVCFTGDAVEKRVASLSGGEMARLMLGKIMIDKPNVLMLDEPTNHLDSESIEALMAALANYPGTLIFVSHDRWFVSELATRILELTSSGVNDFPGTFEEYLDKCGDDHLDAKHVAKTKVAKEKKEIIEKPREDLAAKKKLEAKLKLITDELELKEARAKAIDALFVAPRFFQETATSEVLKLSDERDRIKKRIADLETEWENCTPK